MTAAIAAAVMVSSSSGERRRLEEEKLRVHAKDKKDQSNDSLIYVHYFVINNEFQVQMHQLKSKLI